VTRTRAAALGCGLAVLASSVLGGFWSPATAEAADRAPAARRMLVVSLPMVTWADLPLDRMPNLRGLLDQSIVAGLSARGVHKKPTLGDAYVTISAGTRAVGNARDGDAFEREDGAIVARAFPEIVSHNDDLLYDAHPGALGTALRDAGIGRAAIGNDERGLGSQRPVADALATPDGVSPGGAVGGELLDGDPAAPFGVRLDPGATLAAFRRAWTGRTVVLAEDSDLVRFDAFARRSGRDRAEGLAPLLRRFDSLLGQMLASVDPARDAVMVVGPTDPSGAPQLTVAALRLPGAKGGLAVSAYTRRSGFVSIVDVGPTILDAFHVEAPSSMEGRPFELGRRGGDFADRRSFIVDANHAAVFRDAHVQGVSIAFQVSELVLVVSAVIVFRWGNRAMRRVVELIALTILGFLPAMFLAGFLPFDRYALALYWTFLAGVALAIGLGAWLVSDRRGLGPPMICLTVIVGVLVVDVVTGARLQLNTAFGYSPTTGGRFAGIGNLAYAQLSAAALLLAALLAYRVGGRRGALAATALLGVALVVDGLPIWGADVGGVLSMVPAYAVAVTGLLGLRLRLRSVLIAVGATVVALGVATAIDLARPKDHQTHLGRLVSSTRADGWHSFAIVLERKASANLSALWPSQWTIMGPIVLVFLIYIVWQSPGGVRGLTGRIPPLRPTLVALVVLAVLGFALNDSGVPIPAIMFGIAAPVLIFTLLRGDGHDRLAT
jgi:hypothetical protein